MHELSPELFCNGDNRPANCPVDCRCTHMIDVPLNSIVEIVLVDEGKLKNNHVINSAVDRILLENWNQNLHKNCVLVFDFVTVDNSN